MVNLFANITNTLTDITISDVTNIFSIIRKHLIIIIPSYTIDEKFSNTMELFQSRYVHEYLSRVQVSYKHLAWQWEKYLFHFFLISVLDECDNNLIRVCQIRPYSSRFNQNKLYFYLWVFLQSSGRNVVALMQ